jgi:hypothetical protein
MKLDDLIFENTGSLRSFMTSIVGAADDRLGPNNPGAIDGSTVIELKTQLKRHQLQIANQPPNPNQLAWMGPMDGEWTQALSDAIIQWKKSINLQEPAAKLDVTTPEMSPRALKYLVSKKLYTQPPVKGLLYKSAGGDAEPKDYKKFVWSGRTFDVGHQITTSTESIKNTKDFLLAIGESGWIAILDDFIKTKGVNFLGKNAETRSNAKHLVILMKELEAMQMRHPVIWLKAWEENVLGRAHKDLQATLDSGNEMHYSPRQAPGYVEIGGISGGGTGAQRGSVEFGAQQLYEYFKALATGILRKYKADRDANKPQVDPETGEETIPTMSAQKQLVWVRKMQEALYQGFYEFVPFVSDNDEKSVKDLMRQVRSAAEYDVLTAKYNETFSTDLNEDLAKELSDEFYASYVARPLRLLNRIRPIMLHTAIPFGESDKVSVNYDGVTYTVYKERKNGSEVQVFQRRRLIKNVILQDAILKEAIESKGGSIPGIIAKPESQFLQPAAETVIAAVQAEAAFMVPYYVGSTPFDKMSDPTMGIKRLKGLQEQAARMLQNGMEEQAVFEFVKGESIEDGKWLISTESVHWDAQWKNVNNNIVAQLDGILDDIEPTDEQKALAARLHKEETRFEAMQEIIAEPSVEIFYEDIYRIFFNEHGTHFDERVLNNKTDQIVDYVENGTDFDDQSLNSIVNEVGLAKAAPAMLAKTFQQSLTRGWWGITNNDEDLAFALVMQIQKPEDYALANEWYKKNGNANSLIDDLDGSEWAIIGEGKAVELLKKKLGLGVLNKIAKSGMDPQLENLLQKSIEDPQNTDQLNDILTVLERNRSGIFTRENDDGEVVGLDAVQISAFEDALTKIAQGTMAESEASQLCFNILDAMIAHVEKVYADMKRTSMDDDIAVSIARQARSNAEKNWYN